MNRRYGWMIPALTIGVIGFGLYGFNEHQNRMAAVQMTENQYQGNYHRLSAHVDLLQDALSKMMVTTSSRSIERELSSAQRQSAAAIANLEGLPAKLTKNGSLIRYFTHTSAYLEQLHLSHMNGSHFTAAERNSIQQIYRETTRLEHGMSATQKDLFAKMNSFQMTGAMAANVKEVTLQKQFDQMDGDAKQMLSENGRLHMDPLQAADTRVANSIASGPVYPSTDAVSIAKRFLGYSGTIRYRVLNLGPGFEFHGYLVTLLNGTQETGRLAVSVHRGKVVWMTRTPLNLRSSTLRSGINFLAAKQVASDFLIKHGFSSVAMLRSYAGQQGYSFAFAPVYQGAVIEPQTMLIKVPTNWAGVTDFDASAYYANSITLSSYRPAITIRQARAELASSFKVDKEQLAVVYDPAKHPRLVYSILGRTSASTFRVLVDANSGAQLQIDKLSKEESL